METSASGAATYRAFFVGRKRRVWPFTLFVSNTILLVGLMNWWLGDGAVPLGFAGTVFAVELVDAEGGTTRVSPREVRGFFRAWLESSKPSSVASSKPRFREGCLGSSVWSWISRPKTSCWWRQLSRICTSRGPRVYSFLTSLIDPLHEAKVMLPKL